MPDESAQGRDNMLKDIIEEWKRKGGRCETVTICCPYCHQGMAAEATPDMAENEDLLGELAVETCSCPEAKNEAKRKKRVESVGIKVDAMLGEKSGTPVDGGILDLVKAMSIHVCHGHIRKINIQVNENVRVGISTDTNGLLDIKKEIKNVSRQKI